MITFAVMNAEATLSVDAKRRALEQVLSSRAFSRPGQLRSLMKYLCEMEISGSGAELNEHAIGVAAFGRPQDYSPLEDPCVRSRAYELRKRLQQYNEADGLSAEVIVEFQRGSYVPLFTVRETTAIGQLPASQTLETGPLSIQADPLTLEPGLLIRSRRRLPAILLFSAACLLCVFIGTRIPRPSPVDPIIREAWGPLVDANANVMISIGRSLWFVVRPSGSKLPAGVISFPVPPIVKREFLSNGEATEGPGLEMQYTDNAAAIGDISGIVVAVNTLQQFGVNYQMLPERAGPIPAMRGRNVLLFGSPFSSPAVSELLPPSAWKIHFDTNLAQWVVCRNSGPGDPLFVPAKRESRPFPEVLGLITVLPSQGSTPSSPRRTVIVSGLPSVGTHGALEYFASPKAMQELRNRFRQSGLHGFPSSYQVVVRCKANDTLLLSSEYVAHLVLAK